MTTPQQISKRLRQLARRRKDRTVTANDARRVYQASDEYDATRDLRFLAGVFTDRDTWRLRDFEARSDAPGNHGRRIARFRLVG